MPDTTPATIGEIAALPDDDIVRRASLQTLREFLTAASRHVEDLAEEGDAEALAYGYAAFDIINRDLATLRQQLKVALHTAIDGKELLIERLGRFTKSSTRPKRTDWDALRDEIRTRALVDVDTGEMVTDPAEAVDAALDLIFDIAPLTPSQTARTGGIKGHGMNPEDFIERERDKPGIRFDPASSERAQR